MAVSPVVNNAVQVRLIWSLGPELAINVLNGVASAGVTVNQGFANTLGAAIKSSFTAQLAAQMHPSTALQKVGVRDLRQANMPEFRDSGTFVAGTGTGDPLPKQTALCVTLRTAASGKSFRGRVYLGGFTEAANDANGAILAATTTAALAFLNAVGANFTASGLTVGVLSRPAEHYTVVKTVFHNDGTTTTDTVSNVSAKAGGITAVTAYEARNTRWESQRRRDNARGGGIASLVGGGQVVMVGE